MKKYVWLNLNTGKFSNSWGEELHKTITESDITLANKEGWKLIEYSCLNDPTFDFYNIMKIITNTDEQNKGTEITR